MRGLIWGLGGLIWSLRAGFERPSFGSEWPDLGSEGPNFGSQQTNGQRTDRNRRNLLCVESEIISSSGAAALTKTKQIHPLSSCCVGLTS